MTEARETTVSMADPQPGFDFVRASRSARDAQARWRRTSVADRLLAVAKLRAFIAANPLALAKACGRSNISESLAAEVLPLADACRFLEKTAVRTLRNVRLSKRGRPGWLRSIQVEQHREPFGLVLIVGPSNYPLMLPGIQAIQALVAGNAVLLKPAEHCSAAVVALRDLMVRAGLDERLLQVLPETVEAVDQSVSRGVDKLILTGSATTGRAVQRSLAEELVPATMELSGCDAMFVTTTADIDRAVRCLSFGLTFNGSQTCIAPRRVFVAEPAAEQFTNLLLGTMATKCANTICPAGTPSGGTNRLRSKTTIRAARMVDSAIASGAVSLIDGIDRSGQPFVACPTVLTSVTPEMQVASEDIFAPVTSIFTYTNIDEALALDDACPYALGATVFGSDNAPETAALLQHVNAGCIVVRDMIVPTADPRVAFGGREQSGFGVTRGAAGLEEMTRLKVIVRQNGSWLPHLDQPTPLDAEMLTKLIQTLHGPGFIGRISNSISLLNSALARRRYRRQSEKE